jgi:glycosyltransferase involved in cell wall biosynthesis
MKVLFLSRWLPYPPDNGSRIRIFNLIKELARHHDVALVTFVDGDNADPAESAGALSKYCSSVRRVPYREYRPYGPRAMRGLFSPVPRSLIDTYSPELASVAAEELRSQQYDVVVASELGMAPYALGLDGVPAVLDDLELSSFQPARDSDRYSLQRARLAVTRGKLDAYLNRLLPRFAACTVVSEAERNNLRRAVPEYTNVAVVPNAVDPSRYEADFGTPVPNTLIFAGALSYRANYDAALHLVRDVFPRVRAAVPDVQLKITGRADAIAVATLPRCGGIDYVGYLDDIRPAIAQSWASVVPLRSGGGTRIKIIESMALGTPVVSTPKGAEGLAVTPGENILLADDPVQFADEIVRLLGSEELRRHLSAGGKALVKSRYDWRMVGEQMRQVVERAALGRVSETSEKTPASLAVRQQ